MQAEINAFPQVLDWLLHGGDMGLMAFVAFVGIKVNDRLKRDESLRKDYPPHRHVGLNGSSAIVYPEDYQPAKVEKLA